MIKYYSSIKAKLIYLILCNILIKNFYAIIFSSVEYKFEHYRNLIHPLEKKNLIQKAS